MEFKFSYNDLAINHEEIRTLLGYENSLLPAPFDEYFEEALKKAGTVRDIAAAYKIVTIDSLDEKTRSMVTGEHEFKMGKTVIGELKGSVQLAFFVCTAGKTLSEISTRLLKGEDPVSGYVYDVLGSAIADAAADKMQEFLKAETEKTGNRITNRYSPGYCHWNVSDQHKLFSILGDAPCGVSLTPSALMYPIKSISGVIGIGPEVKYREYQCTLCLSENCVYRTLRAKEA
jgi:hypothetical protein